MTIQFSTDKFGRTVLTVDEVTVTLVPRNIRDGATQYYKNTRVFGAIDALADPEILAEQESWCPPNVKAVVTTNTDEESVRIIKGYRKASRALTRNVKEKLNDLLAQADELLDDGHRAVRVKHFSKTAGCSCPCSPGFVLDGAIRFSGKPVDLHVNVR